MASGSRILINDQGISITTGGKAVFQAGQHKFEGGQRVKAEIPPLPLVNEIKAFTNKWDFYNLFYELNFSDVKYKLINSKNHTFISGTLDEHGRTQRITTNENETYDILIGEDEEWNVFLDDEYFEEIEHYCNACSHENDNDFKGEE